METEVIDMRSKEQKHEDRKRKLKEAWDKFVAWVEAHFWFFFALLGMTFSFILSLVKSGSKNDKVEEERKLKENFVYDRSNGHYVELRRKPTGDEWRELDRRRRNGESVSEIADDMRILK